MLRKYNKKMFLDYANTFDYYDEWILKGYDDVHLEKII